MNVQLVTETVWFCAIDTLFRLRSAPDVPTVPSMWAVPPDVVMRKNVALVPAPAAARPVPFVMLLSVRTPAEDAGAKVAFPVKVASKVYEMITVSGLAGCVPAYRLIRQLAPIVEVS